MTSSVPALNSQFYKVLTGGGNESCDASVCLSFGRNTIYVSVSLRQMNNRSTGEVINIKFSLELRKSVSETCVVLSEAKGTKCVKDSGV